MVLRVVFITLDQKRQKQYKIPKEDFGHHPLQLFAGREILVINVGYFL